MRANRRLSLVPHPEPTVFSVAAPDSHQSTTPDSEIDQNEILEQLSKALKGLAPDAGYVIGLCSPLTPTCDVGWTSDHGRHLKGQFLETSSAPLVQAFHHPAPYVVSTLSTLVASNPILRTLQLSPSPLLPRTFENFPDEEIALFRLELASDQHALFIYFDRSRPAADNPSADSVRRLDVAKLHAILALTELVVHAAKSADLSADTEAQQLQLSSMQAELDEVQRFYAEFSNAIRQCFWVVDLATGKPLIVSENFRRLWGTSAQVLSDSVTGFACNVLPSDRDRVLSEFHLSLSQNEKDLDQPVPFEIELRVIGEDGELRWIWLRCFPTRKYLLNDLEASAEAKRELNEDDMAATQSPMSRLVLIADDITEKKNQEELQRSRDVELISQARMLAVGDLANGVAHEINNPLTVIVGKAAEIKRQIEKSTGSDKGQTPEVASAFHAVSAMADKIQKTSIRISEIVASMQSLSLNTRSDSKNGTGDEASSEAKSPAQKSLVFARTPIEKVIHDLRDLCSEKFKSGLTALEIAEFPSDLMADMNATMITQLLHNLLNNAYDAVATESNRWVKIDFTEDQDSIFLFVTDSGSGVPIKIRSRIFDPFFTTKEPGRGTGLGLALAASIANHHGGVLRLDATHPYTRFVFQLPKQQNS